jgi:hypothetical protein
MEEKTPIPVRLSDDVIKRLDAAADRIGQTRAGIMRFCIETWLKHFEVKGMASLPINWQELLDAMDGRKNDPYAAEVMNDKPKEKGKS